MRVFYLGNLLVVPYIGLLGEGKHLVPVLFTDKHNMCTWAAHA